MGSFKKALHSKIDVFVEFESVINLEIRGQIKKKHLCSFYLGYKDHMYALSSKSGSEPFRFALFLGDLRWNDPNTKKHTKCVMIDNHCRKMGCTIYSSYGNITKINLL